MIAGVSGLPSLGGLNGGIGAGPLPMVGFGVLNNLAGQLLTRPMTAPVHAAPAFAPQELALGQLSNNFGSYFGTTSMPAFWGGPPADLAWRQWATGTAMPPFQVAPFGIPAAAFGAPGGPVGFGVAGMPLAVNPTFGGAQQLMPGFGQMPAAFAGAPQMNPMAFAPQIGQGVSMAPLPPMNFGQAPATNFSTGNWGAGGFFGSQGVGDPAALSTQISRGLQTTLNQSQISADQFSPEALNNAMASAAQQFQKAMEEQKAQQAAQAAMAARISEAGKTAQAAQAALAAKTAETASLGQAAQNAQTTLSAKTNQAAMAAQTAQMAQMSLNMARAAANQSPDDAAATAAVREAETQLTQANQAAQAAKQAQAAAEAEAARTDQAWKASQAAEAPLTARATAAGQAYETLRAEEAAIRQAHVEAFAADAMARMNAMQDQITSSFASSANRFQVPPR